MNIYNTLFLLISLGTGPGTISRTDQLMNIDSIDSRKLRAAARFLILMNIQNCLQKKKLLPHLDPFQILVLFTMGVVHDRVENTRSYTNSIVKKSLIREGSIAARDLRFDINFISSISRLLRLQPEQFRDKRAIRTSVMRVHAI